MSTITVASKALKTVLDQSLPFADPNEMFASLNSVHISVTGGYVTAMATDRFVIGWSRHKVTTADNLTVSIRRTDAIEWAALLRQRPDAEAAITVAEDRAVLRCHDLTFDVGTEKHIRHYHAASTATIMQRLLAAEPTGIPGLTINPELFAPFLTVARSRYAPAPPIEYDEDGDEIEQPRPRREGVSLTPVKSGDEAMLRVTCGPDFIGAIMPIRVAANMWTDVTDPVGWAAIEPMPEPEPVGGAA